MANDIAYGKAKYIANYIANDKANGLGKAQVTAKTIAYLIADTQWNNHFKDDIHTFSMTQQISQAMP